MNGLLGYFVAPDARGDLWVWREYGETPIPVLRQVRADPQLWDAIVALVEGAP